MKYLKRLLTKTASEKNGSCTLEACIILPAVISVLIFMLYVIRSITAVNCLDNALMKTARLMSDYGILYHEYGLEELENTALEKIGSYLKEKTGDDTGNNVLFKFFSLRDCAAYGDDLLYSEAAKIICNYYLSKDPLIKNGYINLKDLSFSGSKFYNSGDEIELKVTCKVFKIAKIGSSVRTRAWIRGDNPLLALDESGVTVWDLGNLKRGKILRSIFGANLPYDYPVISIYDSSGKSATMIKSIDLTAPYYNSGRGLEKEIKEMIDKLRKFETTDGYNMRDGYLKISRGEIKSKKLLLVVPTNGFNDFNGTVLNNILVYASSNNIKVEMVTYQKSNKYIKPEETQETNET